MTQRDIHDRVLAEASRIPLGGVVSLSGENISGYNLAMRVLHVIEEAEAGRPVYHLLCDEPPRSVSATGRQE